MPYRHREFLVASAKRACLHTINGSASDCAGKRDDNASRRFLCAPVARYDSNSSRTNDIEENYKKESELYQELELWSNVMSYRYSSSRIGQLSRREKTCLTLVAQGKSSWTIGSILSISEHTVNFHIKNAMKKLNANSRTVAAVSAVELGIIDCAAHGFSDPRT